MPLVTVQELIEAGVHFGHQASRWNPKMKPFIYGKKHKTHVINLQQTVRGLLQACHFMRHLSSTGAQVVFLGTKRQIRAVVQSEAARCGMPAITERWIGGTLTNFNTVREQLKRLEELEGMEADGSMERHKKKAQSMLRREMRKIQRNLEGVRDLHGLPGALIVVDPRREEITMREAQRMNVPVVAILDTDCDPDLADITIPANDDAMSSVQLLLSRLTDAIIEGRSQLDERALIEAQRAAAEDPRAREMVGRVQTPRGGGPGGGGRQGGGGGGRQGGGGGGRQGGGGGGRPGRQATGRFAERATGHADAVNIGGEAEEAETAKAKAAAETPKAGAEGTPEAAAEGAVKEQPAAPKAAASEEKAAEPAAPPAAETPAAPESSPEKTPEGDS
ncbi:MAG: 30S ribosomal protein S2 [Planctomycetota bacterium]